MGCFSVQSLAEFANTEHAPRIDSKALQHKFWHCPPSNLASTQLKYHMNSKCSITAAWSAEKMPATVNAVTSVKNGNTSNGKRLMIIVAKTVKKESEFDKL